MNKRTANKNLRLNAFKQQLFESVRFNLSSKNKKIEVDKLNKINFFIKNIYQISEFLLKTCSRPDLELELSYSDSFKFLMKEKNKLEKTQKRLKSGRKKIGTQNNDIYLLIYSALENFKNERFYLDEIGKYLSPEGELDLKLRKALRNYKYSDIGLPSINLHDERWERSPKKAIQNAAYDYFVSVEGRFYIRNKEMLKNKFNRVIKLGGYSNYTIAAERAYAEFTE